MGYNTTVVVLNDALGEIENDKLFGKKLAEACRESASIRYVDISSGHHANAAIVIESHHADDVKVITVGGNIGIDMGYHGNYCTTQDDILRSLANSLGYRLVKKKK